MRLPLRLVRDRLNSTKTALADTEIIAALERAGIEVEEVIKHNLHTDVIVVKVNTIDKHPNADRLQIVEVMDGYSNFEIVCGANNIKPGAKVVLAKPGAKLSNGTIIKAAKIRGVASEGMICSEAELGIGEDHSGILLLSNDHALGEPFSTGTVLDIKTASNRPDLNGVLGIIQELVAHLDVDYSSELSGIDAQDSVDNKSGELIVQSEHCKAMYAAKYSLPEKSLSTPGEIQVVLNEAGINLVDPIVDITNYLTLLVGQPMHAFDANKISGAINVSKANKGERIKLLNNKTIELTDNDIVLRDENKAIDLAGVIGGIETSVDNTTTEILLTIGSFEPFSIRRSSTRHGIRTEASSRYERGLPVEYIAFAAREFDALVSKLGFSKKRTEFYGQNERSTKTIELDTEKMSAFLGFKVSSQDAKERLERLSIKSEPKSVSLRVEVPWWRPDINIEQDLFEEVLKIIGLENIPATIPDAQFGVDPSVGTEKWQRIQSLRSACVGAGLMEVNNYSFISSSDQNLDLGLKPASPLLNPLSSEQAHIREGLFPSLLKNLVANRRYHNPRQGIFEISNVHTSPTTDDEEVLETMKLGVMTRAGQGAAGFDWAKGVLDIVLDLAPDVRVHVPTDLDSRLAASAQGELLLDEKRLGSLGLVSQTVLASNKLQGCSIGYFEIDLSDFLTPQKPKKVKTNYQYQCAKRSLTFTTPRNILWQDIQRYTHDLDLNCNIAYKDDYLANETRFLTMDVEFCHPDKTLSNEEVDELELKLVEKIGVKYGLKLKS